MDKAENILKHALFQMHVRPRSFGKDVWKQRVFWCNKELLDIINIIVAHIYILWGGFPLIFMITLWGKCCYYPLLTDEETTGLVSEGLRGNMNHCFLWLQVQRSVHHTPCLSNLSRIQEMRTWLACFCDPLFMCQASLPDWYYHQFHLFQVQAGLSLRDCKRP